MKTKFAVNDIIIHKHDKDCEGFVVLQIVNNSYIVKSLLGTDQYSPDCGAVDEHYKHKIPRNIRESKLYKALNEV
jgi:hypothetical protein